MGCLNNLVLHSKPSKTGAFFTLVALLKFILVTVQALRSHIRLVAPSWVSADLNIPMRLNLSHSHGLG